MYKVSEVIEFMKTVNVYSITNNDLTFTNFITYYTHTFDEMPNCTACPNDIEVAIGRMNWILKMHVKANKEDLHKADLIMNYRMKPKVRIYSTKLNLMVTPFNCTDAIAEVLIKENPNNKNLFIVNDNKEVEIKTEEVETKPLVVMKKKTVKDIISETVAPVKRGRKKSKK